MPTEMPNATKQQLLDLLLALGTLRMRALDSTHGYVSGTDSKLSHINSGSFLGDEEVLTSVTTTDGFLRVDPASITSVLSLEFVDALVVYVWTGVDSTSPIVVFVDTNADNTDMNREGVTGETITAYPPDYILHL